MAQAENEKQESVETQAERIASEAESVRDRVRRLVLDAAGGGGLHIDRLRGVASAVLEGVGKGVERISEERRGTVLAETIDGLSDAFQRAAHATRLAIEEAEGRGERFSNEELRKTADDLRTLEAMFMETVTGFSDRLASNIRAQTVDFAQHTKRAVESMRPSIESAIESAASDPAGLAGQAAAAGADAARGVVGSLFSAAAGMLDAAGEIVSGSGEKKQGREA